MSLSNQFSRSGFLKTADNSAHNIYYEDYGPKDAPAFIMVHGNAGYIFNPADISMFDLQKQRVIVMHMRGVGNSSPAGQVENNCYPELANDIENVRKHLGIDSFTLFGWSGGTTVSLLYAETYPQNCMGLILYGTYLGSDAELFSYYERVRDNYPDGWKRFSDLYGAKDIPELLKLSNDAVLNGSYEDRLKAVIQYQMIYEPKSVTFADMKARLSPHDWERAVRNRMVSANMINNRYGLKPNQIEADLGRIGNIPVLLVNGSEDYVTPPAIAEKLKKSGLKVARAVVLPGADHDVHAPAVQKQLADLIGRFPACIFDKPNQKPDAGIAPE